MADKILIFFYPVFVCGRSVAFYESIDGIDNSIQVADYANDLPSGF